MAEDGALNFYKLLSEQLVSGGALLHGLPFLLLVEPGLPKVHVGGHHGLSLVNELIQGGVDQGSVKGLLLICDQLFQLLLLVYKLEYGIVKFIFGFLFLVWWRHND